MGDAIPFSGRAAAVILSPIVGSFVACVIDRFSRSEDVVLGRSICRTCLARLRSYEMVPIFSYLLLRGKCGRCVAPIPAGLLFAELIYLIFTVSVVMVSPAELLPFSAILTWLLIALAAFDIAHGRLPNALTYALCIFGVALSVYSPVAISVSSSLLGAIFGSLGALLIACTYRCIAGRDGLGGGDVKMLGASGAWIGWQALPTLLFVASSCALVFLVIRGTRSRDSKVSFGPFIGLGTFSIWCWQTAG